MTGEGYKPAQLVDLETASLAATWWPLPLSGDADTCATRGYLASWETPSIMLLSVESSLWLRQGIKER
jgi:hypothetical protein